MLALLKILIKKIQVIGLLIAVLVLNACTDGDKNSSLIFEELNESLEGSNKAILHSTINELRKLENKSHEPVTAERVAIWFPRANLVSAESKKVIDYIDSIKEKVVKSNLQANTQYYLRLYGMLKVYRESVLNSAMEIKNEFENKIPVYDDKFQKKFKNEEQFYDINFIGRDSSKAKSVLLKLENDVRNAENMIVIYCGNQIGMLDGEGFYDKFSVILGQNSKKLSINDELIINGGVGEFSIKNNPVFLINGKTIMPNETGTITYKMKIVNKPGKYKLPVKIKYINQSGEQRIFSDYVEYTVDK